MSLKIAWAAAISSGLSALGTVSDTRTVSPMPRLISCSKAIRVLMMPSGGMPASVTPRWSGTSGRTSANRRFTSITFLGSESLSDTAYRVKPIESSSSQCSRALASIGPIESSSANFSFLAGSTLPQFTPTRMAQSCLAATSAMNRTLSCQGFVGSWW